MAALMWWWGIGVSGPHALVGIVVRSATGGARLPRVAGRLDRRSYNACAAARRLHDPAAENALTVDLRPSTKHHQDLE